MTEKTKPKSAPKSRAEHIASRWTKLAKALAAADQAGVDEWSAELNLDERQLDACRLAMSEKLRLEADIEAHAGAAQERDALALSLSKLNQVVPTSADDCEALARAEVSMRQRHGLAMRHACQHLKDQEYLGGIMYRFYLLFDGVQPGHNQLAPLPPKLSNYLKEQQLDRDYPLRATQPPPPKPRKTLVAVASR